jgi:hypothetical protein
MTYYKYSIVGGYAGGHYDNDSAEGHISIEQALVLAKARGWYDEIELSHHTADSSGHGRGSDDGRWIIDAATGEARNIGGFAPVDDSDDVNDIWDEAIEK